MNLKFPYVIPEVREVPLVFSRKRWRNVLRVECLWTIKLMMVEFCSIVG